MGKDEQISFLLYTSNQGEVRVNVALEGETIWLSQKAMASLFGVSKKTISEHLINIYDTLELEKTTTVRNFRTVQQEGDREVTRNIEYYNLDAIISVGYRVNSVEATQFRKWATKTLKEFLIKGFAIDDERLKQGKTLFGKDYFDELLERVREIRASERRFYQKITDIYADASIDYDPNAEITRTFYKTVQNKLHWAITGHTAAELITERADSKKPNMGLKTWKKAPKGKVLKSDVSVAKNYLKEEELSGLNRIVSMYLDYAENQAERQIPMTMQDWIKKLDAFLDFNDYEILKNAGKISAKVAKKLAEGEYEKFRPIQDKKFESDFDRLVEKTKKKD
ncbi:MAG: virulence RhuM family protein [Balneola sp.]|nr:virulence RhuM family protein [Balneola sp.]MBO6649795.1 virulence RhuM family protein [Balneola sp.]MBO6712358.1 virulence RhuM family protein [Balneola sp.]MBO6800552.1 virulence RhuM family protein [Balneola sp.]MBO6871506.1 virulence RhuM family protein [Balneola sp.]